MPEEDLEEERFEAKVLADDFEVSLVVPELTLPGIGRIYEGINSSYQLSLQPSEEDLRDLQMGLYRAVGDYSESHYAPSTGKRRRRLQNAHKAITDLTEMLKPAGGGLVDGEALDSVSLVANKMCSLGTTKEGGEAFAYLAALQKQLKPVADATAAASAELSGGAAGRPDGAWYDPFVEGIETVLKRAGAPIGVKSEPVSEKPGVLLDLAGELEQFLPTRMRSASLSARVHRVREAIKRYRNRP